MTAKAPARWLATNASPDLEAMASAALLAGEGLLQAARDRSSLTVTEKSLGDFVSDADLTAETTIATALRNHQPHYGWLGEETGARDGTADGLRWIVDPLDGTTNFLKGLPHWAVSIALYQGDAPRSAVIYDPVKGELFSADAGTGAYLNGTPIRVSPPPTLNTALLATGVPAGERNTYLPHCLRDLEALMPATAGIRRWGVASLDLAYVAAGRLDAYWERNLGAWDIAAGVLIVQEAGGVVRPLWPGESILATGSFLAGPPDLLTQLDGHFDRNRVT